MDKFRPPLDFPTPRADGSIDQKTVRWLLDQMMGGFQAELDRRTKEPFQELAKIQLLRDAEFKACHEVNVSFEARNETCKNTLAQVQNQLEEEKRDRDTIIDTARMQVKKACDEEMENLRTKMSAAYHQVLQSRNNIQLYCKVRAPPIKPNAQEQEKFLGWRYGAFDVNADGQQYDFHRVFGPQTSNNELHETLRPMLKAAQADSRHVLLVGFGESGSGKTTTLYDGRRIKQSALLENLAHDLWPAKTQAPSMWSAGIICVEIQASGMYNLVCKPAAPTKQKVSFKESSSGMTAIPVDARYTDNSYMVYENSNPRQYLERQWVRGSANLIDTVNSAQAKRENSATSNNAVSSRGCALLEIRLRHGEESRGVITFVDLMGKEDFTDVNKKQAASFSDGVSNEAALWAVLNDIANHTNRAAVPAKKPATAHWRRTISNSPYRDLPLTKLVTPIKDGLVCGNGAAPYVAVIAHIYDSKDNADKNLKTLKMTKELEPTFKLVAAENCARCSDREREISDLDRECSHLRKQLDELSGGNGQQDESAGALEDGVQQMEIDTF